MQGKMDSKENARSIPAARTGSARDRTTESSTGRRCFAVLSALTRTPALMLALMAAAWLPAAPLEAQIIHRVPYFLSASHPTGQGFLRISNRGDRTANIEVRAVDDAGVSGSTLTLSLDPGTATHFNSDDLEQGNPGKGLAGRAGPGSGDWRLEIEADVPGVQVGSFVRTADFFLTGMGQEAAPYQRSDRPTVTRFEVQVFNPDRNTAARSKLRITNREPNPVRVELHATDDSGMQGRCDVEIAAGVTGSYDAFELEGGTVCTGGTAGWGSGSGKWYVLVDVNRNDDDITVVNLLESASGHVTNLSLPLVYVVGSGSGGAGPVDDHPNTPPGTPVNVPSVTSGELEYNDQDWFRVTPTQPGTLTVHTTGNVDTEGIIEAADGSRRWDNDDQSFSNENFRIEATVQPGDYDIGVNGWSPSDTGSYQLHLEFQRQ